MLKMCQYIIISSFIISLVLFSLNFSILLLLNIRFTTVQSSDITDASTKRKTNNIVRYQTRSKIKNNNNTICVLKMNQKKGINRMIVFQRDLLLQNLCFSFLLLSVQLTAHYWNLYTNCDLQAQTQIHHTYIHAYAVYWWIALFYVCGRKIFG